MPHRQVRDIGYPDLLRPRRLCLFGTWLKQVWMTPEAVTALRGLVIRPAPLNQQSALLQQLKEFIPADFQRRFGIQQVQKFTRP